MTLNDERIQLARRDAVRGELTETGMKLDTAERWCDAWEGEAALRRMVRSAAYWQIGRIWIAEQRAIRQTPR